MNLISTVSLIKQVSIEYLTILEFAEGDIYQYLNSGERRYPTIFLTIESIPADGDVYNVNATLFYVDRLLEDGSNKLSIQTFGMKALKAILDRVEEDGNITINNISYTPFSEKFADVCAGVYASVNMQVVGAPDCDDSFVKTTLTIKQNGVYDTLGYSQVLVVVDQMPGVESLGGKTGHIKLGEGLAITEDNILYNTGGGGGGRQINIAGGNDDVNVIKESTTQADNYTIYVADMRYDDTELKGMVDDISGEVEELTTRVSGDEDRITALETNVSNINDELDELDDIITKNGVTIRNTKSTEDVVGHIYGKASNNLHVDATKVEFHSQVLVDNSLKVDGDLNTQKVSMKGAVHAYDKMTVDGALETQDIHATTINTTDKVTIEGGLSVKETANFAEDIHTQGNIYADNGMVSFSGRLNPKDGVVTIQEGQGASLEVAPSYMVARDSEGELDDFTLEGEDVEINGNRVVDIYAPAVNVVTSGAGVHISAPDNADGLEINGSLTKLRYGSEANVTVDINGVKVFGNDFIYKDSEDNEISIPTELAKIKDLELFKFPNVTIFGQPTINNGQISNFSTSNYLQFPFLVDFAGRHWEINCAITTGEDVSAQHNIFDSNFGLAFAILNRHFVIALSSNGTTWNIGAPTGSYTVLPSTTYYIKISWDGSTYKLAYSLDSTSFINDISIASTESLYPKQIIIGKSLDNRYIFNGSINLNKASLAIADKVIWTGMDDAGLATRMAIDMSNIDDAGKIKLNQVALEGEVGVELSKKVTAIDAGTGGAPSLPFIEEAPKDGKQYARKDGNWDEVQAGGEKVFQLVNDITLSEDASIMLNTTDDGTPYNFDSILIDIDNKTQTTANYMEIQNKGNVLAKWNNNFPAGNIRLAYISQYGYRAIYFTSTWVAPFIGSRDLRSDLSMLPIDKVWLGRVSANSNIKVYAIWKN